MLDPRLVKACRARGFLFFSFVCLASPIGYNKRREIKTIGQPEPAAALWFLSGKKLSLIFPI